MALEWKYSTEEVDWEELSAMYRAAPLGDKKPLNLETVFTNSMFKCLVYEHGRLVGAGRALLERSRGHKKIILYAVPGREPFYRTFWLHAHDNRNGHLREPTAAARARVSQ